MERGPAWPARLLAALAVATSGVVHLYLVLGEDYGGGDGNWLRYAFLAQGIGGIVLAVLLLTWRSVLPLLGAIAFGASTLAGFLLAVYLPDGLLGVHSAWGGWAETVSAITEALAVAAGLWALLLERRRA
ncbi:hypothetical protein [Cellulomonas composti]|uniref:Integral membrane protein n=1 Tax=Cellulomonas composti TaxID=266130 RepID=A0A511JDJ8_9CELL|nr:hypothetical protein [Cellulomonas composti]GEL96055.1 hypothetical protein CCO02nite_27130 [Cellulomonas composti]